MVATRGKQTVFLRDHDSFDPFEWAGGGSGLRGIRAPEIDVDWRDPYDYAALLAKRASLEVVTAGPGAIETSLSVKKDVRNALVGEALGAATRAERTVTFAFPKLGFSEKEGPALAGEVVVADISMPRELWARE